jgi:D-glycero-alpha-D-manno-heptose-7-phosphate kinase
MHRTKRDAIGMKECLLRGDIRQLGVVMESAWQTKKEMAGSITNERIENFYHAAKDAGAYCGKVSGAGGGGFMMFLVDFKNKLRVVDALTATKEGTVVRCHFTGNGVESWRLP